MRDKGFWFGLAVLLALVAAPASGFDLTATGHDSRIDLTWSGGHAGYHVYRSETAEGPFEKLTRNPWVLNVYSDFLGENLSLIHI